MPSTYSDGNLSPGCRQNLVPKPIILVMYRTLQALAISFENSMSADRLENDSDIAARSGRNIIFQGV